MVKKQNTRWHSYCVAVHSFFVHFGIFLFFSFKKMSKSFILYLKARLLGKRNVYFNVNLK